MRSFLQVDSKGGEVYSVKTGFVVLTKEALLQGGVGKRNAAADAWMVLGRFVVSDLDMCYVDAG